MAENNTYNETFRSAFSRVEEVLAEEDSIAAQLKKERYAPGRQRLSNACVREKVFGTSLKVTLGREKRSLRKSS